MFDSFLKCKTDKKVKTYNVLKSKATILLNNSKIVFLTKEGYILRGYDCSFITGTDRIKFILSNNKFFHADDGIYYQTNMIQSYSISEEDLFKTS